MTQPELLWTRLVSMTDRLRSYPCAQCGAAVGEHCVSRTGRYANEHIDRVYRENADWKRDHPNYFEDAARGRDLPEAERAEAPR